MFALVKNEMVTDPITRETNEVQVIKIFAPYTIWEDKNGIQYSPDTLLTLTSTQKQDLGIYDVAYAQIPDSRFYNITENSPTFDETEKIVKITYSSTAKALNDEDEVIGLKTYWTNFFKGAASNILAATDWMLVRKIERNINIPAEVVTYRAAVVTEESRLETAIAASNTVAQLKTAVESANWPTLA